MKKIIIKGSSDLDISRTFNHLADPEERVTVIIKGEIKSITEENDNTRTKDSIK